MKASGWTLWAVVGASILGCGGGPADGESGVGNALQVGRMLGGDGDAEGFAQASSPRPFRFPEDHGAHPAFRSEWWYLTFALEAVGPPAPRSAPEVSPTAQALRVTPRPTGLGLTDPRENPSKGTEFRASERPAGLGLADPSESPSKGTEFRASERPAGLGLADPSESPSKGTEFRASERPAGLGLADPSESPSKGTEFRASERPAGLGLADPSESPSKGTEFRASETPTRPSGRAGRSGRAFGVQFTLFRRALFPDGDPADPWRNGQAYLAHFAVTDVSAGTHHHAERVARGHPQLAGVAVRDGRVAAWLEDWRLEMAADGWTLRAVEDGMQVDLAMFPEKGFVPQGDGGLSAKGPGAASHYYSAPRLRTWGHVEVDGERHPVAGWGWLDREWSTSALSPEQVGWDWFGLMLDSGEDVMAFRLRRRDGARDAYDHGAWIDPSGAARFLSASDFSLTPIAHWQDERGRRWPIRWRLAVGERRMEIAAALNDQRMDTLLTYWEGLVRVTDAQGRKLGRGYMELTGY